MNESCIDSSGQSVCEQVRFLYTELAQRPDQDFGWGKGRDNAHTLGYDPAWLRRLPEQVWESAAAVGNPFALGPIRPDETIVDFGCGAGADTCIAALIVGSSGRVIGVDLTPAMVEKARANAELLGLVNVTIYEADMGETSLPEASADVIISNGSINLSPSKACVLKEALRVLKPAGRLYIADMVRDPAVGDHPTLPEPDAEQTSALWAHCVAGTLAPACFMQMLVEAGFVDAEFVATTGYRTAPETVGALFRARKPA